MEVPRIWRLQQERYTLVAATPTPVAAGPAPLAERVWPWYTGQGTLFAYTVVYDPPAGFEFAAPYVIGLVQLGDGRLVTAQLTDVDPDGLAIGMALEMVTRKLRSDGDEGAIIYGYKFRPLLA